MAWGAAHKGPGIRFVCNSDAVEDPDNRGFWTPLQLFNRWRHNTYKDDREAESDIVVTHIEAFVEWFECEDSAT